MVCVFQSSLCISQGILWEIVDTEIKHELASFWNFSTYQKASFKWENIPQAGSSMSEWKINLSQTDIWTEELLFKDTDPRVLSFTRSLFFGTMASNLSAVTVLKGRQVGNCVCCLVHWFLGSSHWADVPAESRFFQPVNWLYCKILSSWCIMWDAPASLQTVKETSDFQEFQSLWWTAFYSQLEKETAY